MSALLIDIGTPASAPKSRGKSPGRAKGFKCTARTRYPVARKTYSRPKKPKEKKIVVVTLVHFLAQSFRLARVHSIWLFFCGLA